MQYLFRVFLNFLRRNFVFFLISLTFYVNFDTEERADHQSDSDGKAEPPINTDVLQHTRKDVGYKGNNGNGDGVRQLGGHVLDVVALRARRSHDRCVRDGRAVVAANSARKASRHGDNTKLASKTDTRLHNGNENTERAPRGSRAT